MNVYKFSLIDNSISDCYNKYFLTFDHICEYDLNFTNTSNNEWVCMYNF